MKSSFHLNLVVTPELGIALEEFVRKKKNTEDTSISAEVRKAIKKHISFQSKLKTA